MKRRYHTRRRAGKAGAVLAAAALSPLALVVAPAASAITRPASARTGKAAADFDSPTGVAFANGSLWVANEANSSVTEVDPSTGAVEARLTAASYRFDAPTAIRHVGNDLFVANADDTVSEIDDVTGATAGVLSASKYGFDHPVALADADGKLLVLSAGPSGGTGTLTLVDIADGKVVRKIKNPSFVGSVAVTASQSGGHAYVANKAGDSVSDVDLSTCAVTVIKNAGIAGPDGIAAEDGSVWVSDSTTSATTQIDMATDKAVQTIDSSSYGFWDPGAVIAADGNIYVATPYGTSPMVTKLAATNGKLFWYMCNTNGPYYFSDLAGFAVDGPDLWVLSNTGANDPYADAATGSLTEMSLNTGDLLGTVPSS
jgi:DNA-binding beta-propeller fold protein YncE